MSNNGTSIRFAAVILATLALVNVAGAFSGAGSGTESDPYIITNVNQLQEMNDDLDAWYELGNDIDASDTMHWNGGEGFVPIGNDTNSFTGTYDGRNYTITDLFINRSSSSYQGLFGYTKNSVIKNVGLINVYILGYNFVGGLIGLGSATNSYATGSVTGNYEVGGLLGAGYTTDSYATGSVSGGSHIGGLIGLGSATNSYATGSVTGNELVGGLVGYHCRVYGYNYGIVPYGIVSNSYATGNISGSDSVGGLLGSGYATDSYATGNVSGTDFVGGLLGAGRATNSYATGSVTGNYEVGGLVGEGYASTNSYATGGVTGSELVGGLVGYNCGTVSNSYATGNVSGTDFVGGLVGINDWNTISYSYSTGNVSGTDFVGGLVGYQYHGTTLYSYWDIETSGTNISDGGEGKTTAEMQTKSTFTNAGWDFVNIWTIREGVDYPRFIWQALPEPEQLLADLIDYVAGLNFQNGIANSLDAKLDAVLQALDDLNENNDVAAVNALNAFINAVEAQRGNKIPEEDADALIDAAQQIIDLLTNG